MKTFLCLFGIFFTQLAAAEPAPWYSERGLGSTGVSIASKLVTDFWDIPEGTDLAKIGETDALKSLKTKWPAITKGRAPGTKKNIVWRATIPHWGHNGAVVIQERVFLLYEDGWKADAPTLLCLDVHSGKALWEQPVDHLDALSLNEQAVAKKSRAAEHQRYREYMTFWNELHFNNEENRWRTDEERAALFDAFQKRAAAAGWVFNGKKAQTGNSRTRGRFGLKADKGYKAAPSDPARIENANTAFENKWLSRQHWTTEATWYGSTHGSVVSDGTHIYAVTAQNGAACFDLDGKILWVQWMRDDRKGNGIHKNIQAPVLADGKLIYFNRDQGLLYGFDTQTGKQVFATPSPLKEGGEGKNITDCHNYSGHMGPGTTPVVLNISGQDIIVTGNGMVARASDGKLLGLIEGRIHSYFDTAGTKDIYLTTLHTKTGRRLCAIQLGIDGESLTQNRLWVSEYIMGNWEGAVNISVDGGNVYTKAGLKKDRSIGGMGIFELATGKMLKTKGAASEYYAITDKYLFTQGAPRATRNRIIRISDKDNFKILGTGLLVEPPASGEIAERHIAFLGWPEIWTSYTKVTAWGNRLFVRTSDYLWCIGDPDATFEAPAPIGK